MRIMKFEGVAWFQSSGRSLPFDDHHVPGDDPDEFDEDLRALMDQQVGLLPLGGEVSLPRRLSEQEEESIADAFIEWPHGQDRGTRTTSPRRSSRSLLAATKATDREHRLDPPGWVWRCSTWDYRGGRIILGRLGSVPDSGTGPNVTSYGRLRAAVAVVRARRPRLVDEAQLQQPSHRVRAPPERGTFCESAEEQARGTEYVGPLRREHFRHEGRPVQTTTPAGI